MLIYVYPIAQVLVQKHVAAISIFIFNMQLAFHLLLKLQRFSHLNYSEVETLACLNTQPLQLSTLGVQEYITFQSIYPNNICCFFYYLHSMTERILETTN